ncbi:MAG: hypothetical protein JSS20_02000 [Proteobacteria bacterium]|nr:hypothetical protein [Pseudomonadota bacterium]
MRFGRAFAVLIVALAPMAAHAACEDGVTGRGRAANPQNYEPPKHYDMGALARSRAIADWQQSVRKKCPARSSSWAKAHRKDLQCEGYAGGTECTATGVPRK